MVTNSSSEKGGTPPAAGFFPGSMEGAGMLKRRESFLRGLFVQHATAAVRLAYVMTRDRATAEDIVQEAFIRVGGRLTRLRDPDRARAYLFRTVINLCHGHHRGAARERKALERLPARETDGGVAEERIEVRETLWPIIQSLPARQRAALFLRVYADLSESSIADALGCSVGAVKSLLLRANSRLREEATEGDFHD
jgi:RNA polymerase sigma factor (sigma-70 family)